MNKLILITLLTIVLTCVGLAQNEEDRISHTYYYTVSDVDSQEQLQEVFSEIENLKFVTKVKLNYKPEKIDNAQFIVYVSEPKRTSESQQMFEPTELKKIIIDHDLLPTDLTIEDH